MRVLAAVRPAGAPHEMSRDDEETGLTNQAEETRPTRVQTAALGHFKYTQYGPRTFQMGLFWPYNVTNRRGIEPHDQDSHLSY